MLYDDNRQAQKTGFPKLTYTEENLEKKTSRKDWKVQAASKV